MKNSDTATKEKFQKYKSLNRIRVNHKSSIKPTGKDRKLAKAAYVIIGDSTLPCSILFTVFCEIFRKVEYIAYEYH